MAKAEPQVTTVTMNDGRIVEFKGKARVSKDAFVDGDGNISVRMDFLNGETLLCKLPAKLIANAAGHGLSQKLGDSMAGIDDLDDAIEAAQTLRMQIEEGNWKAERAAGTGLSGASALIRALVELTGKTADVVRKEMDGVDAATKKQLEATEPLKSVVGRIKAEAAAKKAEREVKAGKAAPDVSGLMANLLGKVGAAEV